MTTLQKISMVHFGILMAVKVGDLAPTLHNLAQSGIRLEHIHDY
jgi:hypothetical protein